jgi:hypothetical protein
MTIFRAQRVFGNGLIFSKFSTSAPPASLEIASGASVRPTSARPEQGCDLHEEMA